METTRPTEDWNQPTHPQQENKKIVAGICGILLGGLGVHKFILGYTNEGIIMLVISVLGIALSCFFIPIFFLNIFFSISYSNSFIGSPLYFVN